MAMGDGEEMISARFRHSERYPSNCTIDVRGVVDNTTIGLPAGQAYALRDALSACLDEYEEYIKECIERP